MWKSYTVLKPYYGLLRNVIRCLLFLISGFSKCTFCQGQNKSWFHCNIAPWIYQRITQMHSPPLPPTPYLHFILCSLAFYSMTWVSCGTAIPLWDGMCVSPRPGFWGLVKAAWSRNTTVEAAWWSPLRTDTSPPPHHSAPPLPPAPPLFMKNRCVV